MTSPGSGPPPSGPASGPAPRPTPPRPAHQPGIAIPTDVFSSNWPGQATDAIVVAVDKVRDKTTGPIQTAARGLVYGILAAVLATVVAVLVIIGAVRLLDAVQPWGNVWLPYLELGIVFIVAGALIFRRRRLVEA